MKNAEELKVLKAAIDAAIAEVTKDDRLLDDGLGSPIIVKTLEELYELDFADKQKLFNKLPAIAVKNYLFYLTNLPEKQEAHHNEVMNLINSNKSGVGPANGSYNGTQVEKNVKPAFKLMSNDEKLFIKNFLTDKIPKYRTNLSQAKFEIEMVGDFFDELGVKSEEKEDITPNIIAPAIESVRKLTYLKEASPKDISKMIKNLGYTLDELKTINDLDQYITSILILVENYEKSRKGFIGGLLGLLESVMDYFTHDSTDDVNLKNDLIYLKFCTPAGLLSTSEKSRDLDKEPSQGRDVTKSNETFVERVERGKIGGVNTLSTPD